MRGEEGWGGYEEVGEEGGGKGGGEEGAKSHLAFA